jgi:hypothetical protein
MRNLLTRLSQRQPGLNGIPPFRAKRINLRSARLFAKLNHARKVLEFVAACAFVVYGCQTSSKPAPEEVVMGWRPVASWSGHANYQTDSFNIGTGQWRIKWGTSDQASSKGGTFRVIVHSVISGRFVMVAVDHHGAGNGVGYVAEDPREFFLVVESSGLDWKVDVEEGAVDAQ